MLGSVTDQVAVEGEEIKDSENAYTQFIPIHVLNRFFELPSVRERTLIYTKFLQPFLPPEFQSKLKSMFLFSIFSLLDRNIFGNEGMFQGGIDNLNFLATTEITVNTLNGPAQI